MEKSKSKSTKDLSYDAAMSELQGLLETLMSDQVSIDKLYENVTKASDLVKVCQEKLRAIDSKLKETED